jgi:hypothetical protein
MEAPKLEWHEIKGEWVGMFGNQIICMIGKMEDMPCEAWMINPMQGVYVTADSAKQGAQELFVDPKTPRKSSSAVLAETMVPVLESVLAGLKCAATPPVAAGSSSGERPEQAEAKGDADVAKP